MELEQIRKLMIACGYFDYGLDKIAQLEMAIERDADLTLNGIRAALDDSFSSHEIDWVGLAIDSKFVYTSNEVSPKKFDTDELIIFTDSFRWKDIVKPDAVLTIDQRDELKEQFREIGVQYFNGICELINQKDFEWLPFEVKHAYKLNFKSISYTEEDIIFHLKNTVWEYLYPNSLDSERSNSIKEESLPLLRDQKENEGWIEMSQVLESLKDSFPGIDLYELSRVDWGKNIQYKNHYRNPFTLGFKRIAPDSLAKEQ